MQTRNNFRERSIGAILIDSGKLSVEDAEKVLAYQRGKSIKFGDAALEMGVLNSEDIESALAVQFDYPYLHERDDGVALDLVAAYEPFSKQVEQIRGLRSQLLLRFFSRDDSPKTLLVSSPGKNEGRSYLAANLAVVFSQLGEQTLLIDADLRNPKQHNYFGLNNKIGLSSILSGRSQLEDVRRIPSLANLSVLPSGPTPPNPLELLSRDEYKILIAKAKLNYDVIIIDSPAALEFSDAQTLAGNAEGVVLSVRKNITSIVDLEKCADSFNDPEPKLLGVVLANF